MSKNNNSKPKTNLSASRVKTYEGCSALYYYKYVQKVPDESNTGAKIGTIAHLAFELLLKPRHVKLIQESEVFGTTRSKVLSRFFEKHLRRQKILDDKNISLIHEMVSLGLRLDYFAKGGKLLDPEIEFNIDYGDFKMLGYIDRAIQYPEKGIIKIQDYKTSKKKFAGDDRESNLQAMMYSLAALKLWPEYKPVVEFLFLQFPKDPIIRLEFSQDELDGLKYYLADIQKKLDNFGEKDILSHVAANDQESKWMCFAGKTWKCPYLRQFDYYVLLDKEGKIVLNTKDRAEAEKKIKDDLKFEKRSHNGCEAHKQEKIDWFD